MRAAPAAARVRSATGTVTREAPTRAGERLRATSPSPAGTSTTGSSTSAGGLAARPALRGRTDSTAAGAEPAGGAATGRGAAGGCAACAPCAPWLCDLLCSWPGPG